MQSGYPTNLNTTAVQVNVAAHIKGSYFKQFVEYRIVPLEFLELTNLGMFIN